MLYRHGIYVQVRGRSKIAFAASEKLSTLKGKNLLPAGANSFLLE